MASSARTEQEPASYDVADLRASEFAWSARAVYLDDASVGPLPERTRHALDAYKRKRWMPFDLGPDDMFGVFAESRRLTARLINADPSEISLSTYTSIGTSLAARAVPLPPAASVLFRARESPATGSHGLTLPPQGLDPVLSSVPPALATPTASLRLPHPHLYLYSASDPLRSNRIERVWRMADKLTTVPMPPAMPTGAVAIFTILVQGGTLGLVARRRAPKVPAPG